MCVTKLLSQALFYSTKNFQGIAAHKVFTPRLRDFYSNIILKYGRGPYNALRQKGFGKVESTGDDVGEDVKRAYCPSMWEGALVMPHSRTIQKKFNKDVGKLNVVGFCDEIFEQICKLYKRDQVMVHEKGQELVCCIETDETDCGIEAVMWETINGKEVVFGTVNYGGLEEYLGVSVIDSVARTKFDVSIELFQDLFFHI